MVSGAITAALSTLVVTLSALLATLYARMTELRARYKFIIDAEAEGRRLQADARREVDDLKAAAGAQLGNMQSQAEEQKKRRDALSAENSALAATHDLLKKEISTLEEELENISFGMYKPHFDYDSPEAYKSAIEKLVEKQREMVRSGKAVHFAVEWTVGGSRRDGERMQRQYSKLLLRAFNGEAEAAIAKVAWNNARTMEERIRKAYDAINALGGVMQLSIVEPYMNLKLSELRLKHELEEKKRATLEEQRRVREQIKEQERVQRELEAAAIDSEEQEERFVRAIENARVDAARAQGVEHTRLTNRILELEAELNGVRQKRERIRALAELTRAGYVYVISNIGSFGEHVYKIGMTRRLDPMDRIKELSDASVPFKFDVHAMFYSEDAVAIEAAFHERFADKTINHMNSRKEFFRVSMDELEAFGLERGFKIAFTRLAEAREYRETMAHRRAADSAAV